MAIEARKRENEAINSLIYRFNRKVQQSGLVKETRKRTFTTRPANRTKRRDAALYRIEKRDELVKVKKYGHK
jgi:ribosomal protein S21